MVCYYVKSHYIHFLKFHNGCENTHTHTLDGQEIRIPELTQTVNKRSITEIYVCKEKQSVGDLIGLMESGEMRT